MADNKNVIQHGLAAARQAAQEEGMTNCVEELANNLQANAGATAGMQATAGANAAADDQMASDANQGLS